MQAVYRFGPRRVRVISLYPAVHAYCAGYRAEGEPDFSVRTTGALLEAERSMALAADRRLHRPEGRYSDEQLEILAVYRLIAERMPLEGALLFHGSALMMDGRGYCFAAPSGTGKSTHARLWRERFGARVTMINDDKPLLAVSPEGVTVYGTPYCGKHRLGSNTAAPLQAVALLSRGKENAVRPLSRREACAGLLQQVYRPQSAEAMRETLRLFDILCSRVPLFALSCNMEPSAAETAYNAMKGPAQ